jgi:hypothetical protein
MSNTIMVIRCNDVVAQEINELLTEADEDDFSSDVFAVTIYNEGDEVFRILGGEETDG